MSKRQAILDWLVDESGPLRGIKTNAGYANTIGLLQRGQRDMADLAVSDYPCLFIGGTDETRKNLTGNQFESDLAVELIGGVKNPTGMGGNQAQMDSLIADITKALSTDLTQGSRVKGTVIRRIRTDRGDIEPYGAYMVNVVFRYVSEGTDP